MALTYWYVLLIGARPARGAARAAPRPHADGRRAPSRTRLRDVGIVLGGIVVVTAIYWLPLAVSVLTTSGAQPMQNRYFTGDEVSLPERRSSSFDLRGFVLLAGLVWLAATALRRPLSMHLLGLVGAAYVVYLIGYLGFLADTPIDTLRVNGVIEFALAAGAALGAMDLARLVVSRRLYERVDPAAASPRSRSGPSCSCSHSVRTRCVRSRTSSNSARPPTRTRLHRRLRAGDARRATTARWCSPTSRT